MVQEIFDNYLMDFMRVFIDDFSMASDKAKHFFQLRLCLQRLRESKLKLNSVKCNFTIRMGVLLGPIVSIGSGPRLCEGHDRVDSPKKPKGIGKIHRQNQMAFSIH